MPTPSPQDQPVDPAFERIVKRMLETPPQPRKKDDQESSRKKPMGKRQPNKRKVDSR